MSFSQYVRYEPRCFARQEMWKETLCLKSTTGNAALPLANMSECVRLFLNAVKQLEKEVKTQVLTCWVCWHWVSHYGYPVARYS